MGCSWFWYGSHLRHRESFPSVAFTIITTDYSWPVATRRWFNYQYFPNTKVDLVPCFPDIFRSYLEDFDEYSSEHLDCFHEDDYQPLLCSGLDRSKDLLCLMKDPCDNFPQPAPITLPPCVSRGVVGNYFSDVEFPLGQTLESKGWLDTTSLSLLSQFFDFPLTVCQSSSRSLSIPSLILESEDVLGSQFADLLSQFSKP